MGGGDTGGDGGVDAADTSGVVECTVTPILQDNGQPFRELVDTAKPKKKSTKHTRERDDMTSKVLNILKRMMMMMKSHWHWLQLERELRSHSMMHK